MANVNLSSVLTSPNDRPPVSMYGYATSDTVGGFFNNVQLYAEPIASGALTANVFKSVLVVNAPGVVKFVACRVLDATVRTIALRVTIDGNVVFNDSLPTSQTSRGINCIGNQNGTGPLVLDRIPFNSLLIELSSTLTETGTLQAFALYDLV